MTLLRQSSLAAVAAIVLSGSRFALAAIVARRLSPAGFGQFVYAQWLVDITFLVCSFGTTGAVSRYAAEYRSDEEKLSAFIRQWRPWALGIPLLAGVGVLAGSWLSGLTLSLTSVIFLALWAIASAAWAMQTAALTGYQRFDLIFYANLIAAGIMLAGALLLPVTANNPAILFVLMAAASGMAALLGLPQTLSHKIVERVAPIKDGQWRSVRRYAANMWLVGLLWSLVWSRGEMPLVRWHLGDTGVAEYTVALTLFFGANQGIMLWVSGIAPHLTSEWGRGHKAQAIAVARRISDIQLLLSGCFALLLTCFGPEILGVIFGTTYRTSAASLSILALGLITLSASAQNHLLQIDTDAKFNRNTSLIGLIMLFSIASFTIPWLGIAGAAISRMLTMWFLFLISLIFVWRSWGSTAFSGRNVMVVVCIVLVPVLTLDGNDVHFIIRALLSLMCLAALALMVRGQDGQLVATETVRTLWFRIFQRAETVKH